MNPPTANTQFFNQFERSPEAFPKTIVFPEAWDLSEFLNSAIRPEPVGNTQSVSGTLNEKTSHIV